MKEFYRQREPQLMLTPVQMNPLIQQVIDLSRARWSNMSQQRGISIKVETELAPEPPAILGSKAKFAKRSSISSSTRSMPCRKAER
jgi:hypothetical protein